MSLGLSKSLLCQCFMPTLSVTLYHHFQQKEKKSAWTTWMSYDDVTSTFLSLSTGPLLIKDEDITVLERFTILLYNRTSSIVNIDDITVLERFTILLYNRTSTIVNIDDITVLERFTILLYNRTSTIVNIDDITVLERFTILLYNRTSTIVNIDDITVLERFTILLYNRTSTIVNIDDITVLERFTILLYNHTSTIVNIDEVRRELFTKKEKAMDALPPTKAALLQHIRRAVYQGGHCWGNMLHACLDMPTPGNWGWVDPNNWKPLWTTLPEASVSSRELLCCGCKKGCTAGRCKCKKAALNCTALCQCGGECDI